MLIEMLKKHFLNLYIIDMAAFDQISFLHLKKNLLFTLLILTRIKLPKQTRKRIFWIRKIRSSHLEILLNISQISQENICVGVSI